LNKDDSGFFLDVTLNAERLGGIDQSEAETLVTKAHTVELSLLQGNAW
jgi:organic hydroperoxide reductase OsmC/OhrA